MDWLPGYQQAEETILTGVLVPICYSKTYPYLAESALYHFHVEEGARSVVATCRLDQGRIGAGAREVRDLLMDGVRPGAQCPSLSP